MTRSFRAGYYRKSIREEEKKMSDISGDRVVFDLTDLRRVSEIAVTGLLEEIYKLRNGIQNDVQNDENTLSKARLDGDRLHWTANQLVVSIRVLEQCRAAVTRDSVTINK